MLAAVAETPVWTVSQPGAGPKYGGVPHEGSGSPGGAVLMVGEAALDGEPVVVGDAAVDGEPVVVVAHRGGVVAGGGVSFGM